MPAPPGMQRPFGLRVLIVAAALFALLPAAILPLSIWASSESWDVEASGLGYWLLVSGTRLDRLGLVAPTPQAPHYSVAFAQGNSPGWSTVSYRSLATPDAIIAHYAARCEALSLAVIARGAEPDTSSTTRPAARLTCQIEPYLDIEVSAERRPDGPISDVRVRVWGRD